MQRSSGEHRSRGYATRHVVPIGGADFVSPRRAAALYSSPQSSGMSSADAYQKASPARAAPMALPSAALGATRRSRESSGDDYYDGSQSSSTSSSSDASSAPSPTSPTMIGGTGSSSSWKIQQDSYSEALYRHTSAMWEADRRSMERASLDPNAVTLPMQHSSRLSMQLNPPGRPSSVESSGPRRVKSLRVSKQQGISSADVQKDASRSKSLRRFL